MIISSKDNGIVKEIRKLKEKKYRKDKFIVEGIKMLEEAINENASIDLIIIREDINLELDISKFNSIVVTEKVFNTLTDVVSPQGVLAIINKKNNKGVAKETNMNIDKTADYILALDGIQDPGNLGTIIRTADSANLKQIIVSKNTVDAYSPKVIRSTMGAIYRVNIIEVENLGETLKDLQKDGFKVVVTSLDTNNSIYDISYNKSVVVIGNEANGVSKEVQELANEKVKIPMLGKTESLNAAVATGIMIYEYVRRNFQLGTVLKWKNSIWGLNLNKNNIIFQLGTVLKWKNSIWGLTLNKNNIFFHFRTVPNWKKYDRR